MTTWIKRESFLNEILKWYFPKRTNTIWTSLLGGC
jgi:hypothetical protein